MKEMPENSVDAIVTDPPYELGFMGKSWDSTGIANSVEMWSEALRVLKPGGHLLAFSGSRTYHRMTCAIEDAGFEIRDQIMWVYGSGFPKSHNISKGIDKSAGAVREVGNLKFKGGTQLGVINDDNWQAKDVYEDFPSTPAAKQWDGWGTALKPAHEPIVLARKPLIGTVANNVLTFGTGGLNIDGARVEGEVPSVPMAEWTRSGTTGATDQRNGEMSQSHPLGRFPANFIHDGSDEVVELFPNSLGAGGSTPGVKTTGFGEFGNGSSNCTPDNRTVFNSGSGSTARFFYCAKTSKRDRNEGLDGFPEIKGGSMSGVETREGKPTNHPVRANHHPTVKPTDLMRYLCRLITPPNGIVLDPFMGSGSTGKACSYEGFDFIGIDQSAEYVEIARARIEFALQEENTKEDEKEYELPF